MAPANLHGLNLVHPAQAAFDSQDLLSGTTFPDLTAQLDLWTNLPFDSEEGPILPRHDNNAFRKAEDEDDDDTTGPTKSSVSHDTSPSLASGVPSAFAIQSFLNTFGIDPFAAQRSVQHVPPAATPSLAQLLALHSSAQGSAPQTSGPASNSPSLSLSAGSESPPAKRARTRKVSVSTTDAGDAEPASANATPLSAAEDKRRRNTAASARFRLKKKEREAALEGKAKELETRVNELERECEALRRENGWLKGLVVGVTGAAQSNAASKRQRDED